MDLIMHVVKRDGRQVPFDSVKITKRLARLCSGFDMEYIKVELVSQKVSSCVRNGISTSALDDLIAQTAASFTTHHHQYGVLAGRICASRNHKITPAKFSDCMKLLWSYVDPVSQMPRPLIADGVYDVVLRNAAVLDDVITDDRDYCFDYFGFMTLEKSYLLRIDDNTVERPQYMFMRTAIAIHMNDISCVIETYENLANGVFTHASPTLFNAGTPKPQMASCFLLGVKDYSIEGIFETMKQCAIISEHAGGIGLNMADYRAGCTSLGGAVNHNNSIIPVLRVFNNIARCVSQGNGKRKGSIAVYIEPWHPDIFPFLELRKNHGNESDRARDIFCGLWIPDLFMIRVEQDREWTLMCPDVCPGLAEVYGDQFTELYENYEHEGRGCQLVSARKLWYAILDAQVETGTPYMLYKDHCNRKSNQQHLGTIKCSNLCAEIIEYTSSEEVAVCNIASISLPSFVTETGGNHGGFFDFIRLCKTSKLVTRNLDLMIDRNLYPVKEAMRSNLQHRPIGIGVQGLADVFQMLMIPFDSPEARELNKDIFETIYFGALSASCELAMEKGSYRTYDGSPASKGKLQFDLWGVVPSSDRWDWASLRKKVAASGLRNSLLTAVMPTASTAQILGNHESVEPSISNMYCRRVLSGEFVVVNKHLVHVLSKLGLWNSSVRNQIVADGGSVQNVKEIPDDIRNIFKTTWEIPQKSILDMAADRGPYICQSQSLNLHLAEPTTAKLTSMHFYGWKQGLKTGLYYLRTRPRADPIQFTVDRTELKTMGHKQEEKIQCFGCGA